MELRCKAPPATEICDRLWLAGANTAEDKKVLQSLSITHIVNVTYHGQRIPRIHGNFGYMHIRVRDVVTDRLTFAFESSSNFIEEALRQGGSVLVHCFMGKSRSSIVILAYLMSKRGMTLRKAFEHVKSRRSIIKSNATFGAELCLLDRKLHGMCSLSSLHVGDVSANGHIDWRYEVETILEEAAEGYNVVLARGSVAHLERKFQDIKRGDMHALFDVFAYGLKWRRDLIPKLSARVAVSQCRMATTKALFSIMAVGRELADIPLDNYLTILRNTIPEHLSWDDLLPSDKRRDRTALLDYLLQELVDRGEGRGHLWPFSSGDRSSFDQPDEARITYWDWPGPVASSNSPGSGSSSSISAVVSRRSQVSSLACPRSISSLVIWQHDMAACGLSSSNRSRRRWARDSDYELG